MKTGLFVTGSGYTKAHHGLTAVPSDIPLNTSTLDLSYNSIAVFDSEKLAGCNQMEEIIMTSNQLTSFPNLTHVASTLRYLKLNRNQITVVNYNFLDALQNLFHLKLHNNLLTSLPNPPGPSQTLSDLDVGDNQFGKRLPRLDIIGKNLHSLRIDGTNIGHLEPEDLMLSGLEILYSMKNGISKFPNLTYIGGSLKELYLGGNSIELINAHFLNLLTSLTKLSLSSNRLTHLSNFHVNGTAILPKLDYLELTGNRFTALGDTSEIMALAPKLTQFLLGWNQVSVVPTHLNTTMIGAKFTVQLMQNKIETLPIFDGSLIELSAYINPIICDNALKWLICDSFVTVGMLCDNPLSLKGRPYSSLTIRDLTGIYLTSDNLFIIFC